MTSLIKNQIIKRLSKFVKNLSSNQINLSTLKGEGELSSINLDESAIEELIELPTWLKIQRATCGRLFIKIPWTSLKTLPIQIQLDDVIVEIETCEKLRDLQSNNGSSTMVNDPLLGKYGFTNRVIDGITLNITNVTLQIKAQVFKASIFLPSLDIYSTTPDWRQVENLTLTRLRNAAKDHILLFKEISWPNARIEASSKDNSALGTAIRLIANSCRIRIAMKKNMMDSSMVTSRVMLQFDDLLSVVNDAQLNSALNTYKEIMHLMKRASEQKKRYAGEKLTKLDRYQQPSSFQPKQPNACNTFVTNCLPPEQPKDAFGRHDVIETSLHFNVKRLDLHIIADCEPRADRVVENGSIQITIANVSLDHYPYHEFGSSKRHWMNYNEMQSSNRDAWATRLNEEWQEQLNTAKASAPVDESSVKFEKALRTNRIRMFESSTVINIDDFVFYPVSLNNDKQHKRRRPLITSDKTFYQLPESLGIFNIQHSEYYYPLPYSFPVPNSDLFIQIMPVVLRVDFATCSWLSAFISTLSLTIDKSGILKMERPPSELEHVAIQLEVTLPRIILSSESFLKARDAMQQTRNDQPRSDLFQSNETSEHHDVDVLELSVSRILLTNVRTARTSSRNQLEKHLELFEKENFFRQTRWPFSKESNNRRVSTLFEKHPYETYLYNNPLSGKTGIVAEPPNMSEVLHTYFTMTTNSLKKSAKCDIWHYLVDNVYLEFTPASKSSSMRLAKQNMIDSVSISGWAVLDEKREDSCSSPWINVLCVLESPSMLKISQKQYTFFMHVVDELEILLNVLSSIKKQTTTIKKNNSIPIGSSKNFFFTFCLSVPTTFTLAVIDELQETLIHLSNATTSASLTDSNEESALRDASESNILGESNSTSLSSAPGTMKHDSSLFNINTTKNSGMKKSKNDESLIRGTDASGQVPSFGSSISFSESNDETSSQWDISEDLDADYEASIFGNDFDTQQPTKAVRLDIDEDRWSSSGKNNLTMTALDSASGVFIKLNRINVCVKQDETESHKPVYVACSVKYLRIDEFDALKFDSIKPKLFNNERADDWNPEDVSTIDIRVDLIPGDPTPPPRITLQLFDRSLVTSNHALEILTKNLEELLSYEDRLARKDLIKKLPPLEIHLKNVEILLKLLEKNATGEVLVELKPPLKIHIEHLNLTRQIDGQITIDKLTNQNESNTDTRSKENLDEISRQTEFFRLENERLRAELINHQTEITVLRGERDSLMKTISKLDVALTQAEYLRLSQQESAMQNNPRKK